ncbi:hypothetical protein NMY22_g7444 [Coprinellus aureogranulatus]|nr:hypothetical protein NMY22_g7444 [Coprinellus aureogranulatus]
MYPYARLVCKCLMVAILPLPAPILAVPLAGPSASNPNGLHNKLAAHGKLYFGTAVDPNILRTQKAIDIAVAEFGAVSPLNSMKWDATEPSRDQFLFTQSDAFMEWAVSNGKLVRGHTLGELGSQHLTTPNLMSFVVKFGIPSSLLGSLRLRTGPLCPKFMVRVASASPPALVELLSSVGCLQVSCTLLSLASSIKAVHSEVLTESGALRSSVFTRVMGEDFVGVAFRAARKADPDAVLYINEYNIESDNAKLRGLVALVDRINSASPRTIDAIGLQAHLATGGSSGLERALEIASAAEVKEVAITQLDVTNATTIDYVEVVKACISQAKCVGITVWGIADIDRRVSLLLWDGSYRPRSAYTAIIEAL